MGRRRTIIVVVDEPVGESNSEAVERATCLALGLAKDQPVVFCSPLGITTDLPGVKLQTLSGLRLSFRLEMAPLVIASRTAAGRLRRRRRGALCVDLGSFPPTGLVGDGGSGVTGVGEHLRLTNAALRWGDFFLCASETDRDSWLGALAAAGRFRASLYDADPKLRRLLDVAPLGDLGPAGVPSVELPEVVRLYCRSPWENP